MNFGFCIRLVLVAALFIGAGSSIAYSGTNYDDRELQIVAIESGELADLVAIRGGLNHGVETGMLLSVFRDGAKLGELIVTSSRGDYSAALITQKSSGQAFAIGDRAIIKAKHFN